jgi:hypothetical protein
MAARPELAIVLLAMGIHALSVTPRVIPELKQALAGIPLLPLRVREAQRRWCVAICATGSVWPSQRPPTSLREEIKSNVERRTMICTRYVALDRGRPLANPGARSYGHFTNALDSTFGKATFSPVVDPKRAQTSATTSRC